MTDDLARPTALFLSAHLDDVAFSCGGTIAACRRQGWRAVVATAFTASVSDPRGFALACQLDKGLAPDVDYMAIRRAEDTAFGQALGGVELIWLDLPEAPHRGYHSAPELFAAIRPEDEIAGELTVAIQEVVDQIGPRWIFAPQAVGGHVDHRQLVRAALGLRRFGGPIIWYRDLPYAAKRPDAPADPDLPAGLIAGLIPLTPDDMEAKLNGCACYASQVAFQFGAPPTMRDCLLTFAASEAARLGVHPAAESILAHPDSGVLLAPGPFQDQNRPVLLDLVGSPFLPGFGTAQSGNRNC